MPLIRVMEVGSAEQKTLIQDAIRTGDADFVAVARAIQDTKALDYTRQAAVAEAQLAREALAGFPVSVHQDSLLEFCSFAVERDRSLAVNHVFAGFRSEERSVGKDVVSPCR